MKKIFIFAAALAAMTACNKSVFETAAPSEGFGYINLGISADAEMVVTKTTTTPADINTYNVRLLDNNSSPVWKTENGAKTDGWMEYSEAIANTNLWQVAAGTYTVEVENLTVTEAYANTDNNDNPNGKLRLAGSSDVFTVVAGKTTKCDVTCKVANAKVTFITDANFNSAFVNPSVSVSQTIGEATRTVDMGTPGSAHDAEGITAAFFEAGTAKWTLKATLKGETGENTYSNDITLTAGKWSQVKFSTTKTDGTISLTVTVDDSMDAETITATIDPNTGDITQTVQTNQTNQPDQTDQPDQPDQTN